MYVSIELICNAGQQMFTEAGMRKRETPATIATIPENSR